MLRPIAGATFELPLKPFLCYDVSGKLWHLANYRDFFPPIKKTYRSYWALPKGLSQYFIIHMKDFFPLHRNFKEAIFINNCLIFSLSSRPLEVTRWKERSVRERHAREEGPTSLVCVPRAPRFFLRPPLQCYLILLNNPTHPPKMVGKLIAKWGIS